MINDPSVQRYQGLRQKFDGYPATRGGVRMNVEHIQVPEENGVISMGSRVDSDPETPDIIKLSRDGYKGNYTAETFVETPAEKTWWGGTAKNAQLTHLTRDVNRVAGGYGLTGVALRTVDLVTGEATELTGKSAIRQAQKFQDEIPFRLHNIDPIGMEREEENWLIS